jgi:hypothetical protein
MEARYRCQYHARPRRFFPLLQPAVGIIVEFELDRPNVSRAQIATLEIIPEDRNVTWSLGRVEQRAVVACYYLSSKYISLLFSQFLWENVADTEILVYLHFYKNHAYFLTQCTLQTAVLLSLSRRRQSG